MAPKRKSQKIESEEEGDPVEQSQTKSIPRDNSKLDELKAELGTLRFQVDSLVDSQKISSSLAESSNGVQKLMKDEIRNIVDQVERNRESMKDHFLELEQVIARKIDTIVTKQHSMQTSIEKKLMEMGETTANDGVAMEEGISV